MAARFTVALPLLLACVVLAAAHPRLRSLDVGAFHEFPADEWSMATESLKYERHLIAINNGLSTYAGNPSDSRTVKLEVYFPPVVLPTPMEMPGWKAEMYPCESSGKLQCDGWNVVSYTAHSWDYSFNNSYYYNFPIGIRLKDDCKCNVPLVCEIVDVESVPGVEAGDEPAYLIWIPSIQYTSTSSTTPDYAVFWTHNWDAWKGERDNVRADMLLDFTDHPMYIWKNGPEPSDDYTYSNGRRAVKAKVTDWANCNYMEFNGKRIAVPELDVPAISSSSGKDTAKEVGAPTLSAVNNDNDNTLAVVALGMAVAALIVGVGAVAYAHMMVMSARNQVQPSATMDGASKPVKMGA